MKTFYKVTYKGFLDTVERYFYTEAQAETYLRQVGHFYDASARITQECGEYYPLTILGVKRGQ